MTSIAGDMKIPDGPTNRIASIWDVASGRLVMKGIVEDQYSGPAALSPDGRLIAMTSDDKTMHIWDVHTATMSVRDLLTEVCTRRLRGMTRLGRDEMRLIGHPDTLPEIDVCDGIR
jgi:WD40 repeat protein